jgi:cytochrome P450
MSCLPPGPPEPMVLQVARILRDPYAFFEQCRRDHGDVFTTRFAGEPYVWLADPELVKWVFTRPREVFVHANDRAAMVAGERSVLFMDNNQHRRERHMLMPAFHGNRMRSYGETMRDVTHSAVAAWSEGKPFAVHSELQAITSKVILANVFGMSEGLQMVRLQRAMKEFLNRGMTPMQFGITMLVNPAAVRDRLVRQGQLPSNDFRHKLRRALVPFQVLADARVEIDQVLFAEIARCREQADPERGDILAMLVGARDEQGEPMTDEELRDELLTLLIAGHETTATTLSWALHHILRTAGVAEKIVAELDAVFADGPLDPAKFDQLRYLKAVINETLRLSPIALGVLRRLGAPTTIAGHELPAGTVIAPCIYLMHRNPNLWDAPESFQPERFLARDPSPFVFFPFGGGTRRCVGLEFARYQMRVVLAQIFRSVSPAAAPGFRVRPEMRGFTVGPSVDMPIVVRARN